MTSNPKTTSTNPILDFATEKALIIDLKYGLPLAVEKWYSAYKPHLTAYVSIKIQNSKDRDELIQEVFMHSLKQLPLFRGDSSLWTWMCSIARHEIADYYRKKYAKKALKTIPLVDWLVCDSPQDAQELSETVRVILSKMSAKNRSLLLKKYLDDFSVKQLATQQQKTEKSIESDLFRARKEFKALWFSFAEA
jgi:RNA polymerase sigma-70 factor, ECF subfamily